MSVIPMRKPLMTPDRGRLMTDSQVAEQKFQGAVSTQWVRRNVRPKVRLGHNTVMFYERDVDDWIAARREDVA